jgi:hypothetical protein
MRAEGQTRETDMTKLRVTFRNFAKGPKKYLEISRMNYRTIGGSIAINLEVMVTKVTW